MMKRMVSNTVLVILGLLGAMLFVPAAPADAQIVRISGSDARHTVNFNVGYFALAGVESRDADDVFLPNLVDFVRFEDFEPLEVGHFNRVTFGGEWLYAISDYLDVGAGLGFNQKTVQTEYAEFEDEDGTPIVQDLKLRVIPVTATVRFLPLGRETAIQPYVGAGIGLFNWRYSEIGEFIDDEGFIFSNVSDPWVASGTAVGPVVVFGIQFPVDTWSAGADFRWHKAEGDGLLDEGFIRDKINIGGWTTSFTFGVRF